MSRWNLETAYEPRNPGQNENIYCADNGIGGGIAVPMSDLTNSEIGFVPSRSNPVVEIVVPVYNEARTLTARVSELRRFLDESFPYRAMVTVVDNASTDNTFALACALAALTPGVTVLHLANKGRGLALRSAWSTSTAPVVAYMDADLSTSLTALSSLVGPLLSDECDVVIGTRRARGAHVVRGPKRELVSRVYNRVLKISVGFRFSDAQCGFKAMRRESAHKLLPLIEDDQWFFDTELLFVADRLGMRIREIPVDWVEDCDSRVRIGPTALSNLRGIWRIRQGRSHCQAPPWSEGSLELHCVGMEPTDQIHSSHPGPGAKRTTVPDTHTPGGE
jgi:glycosyltransferase involved in cell wall biosynthesis